jgi:hypothetical protein
MCSQCGSGSLYKFWWSIDDEGILIPQSEKGGRTFAWSVNASCWNTEACLFACLSVCLSVCLCGCRESTQVGRFLWASRLLGWYSTDSQLEPAIIVGEWDSFGWLFDTSVAQKTRISENSCQRSSSVTDRYPQTEHLKIKFVITASFAYLYTF